MSDTAIQAVLDALADEQHANLCNCRAYPDGCVSNTGYTRDYLTATLTYAEDALAKALQQGWQLPVSGVSEPTTPTPRPGDMVRLWVGGKEGVVVGELVLITDDDDPAREYVRAHADGREWLVAPNGQRRRVEVLSEVVPEGTDQTEDTR